MEVEFCDKCDNLFYLYLDSDTKKINYICKSCGNKKDMDSNHLSVNNNTNINIDKSDVINTNPFISHDITIPTIKNNKNITCKNELCDAEEVSIKYIKYDEINMKYLYICNHCGFKWKNNL